MNLTNVLIDRLGAIDMTMLQVFKKRHSNTLEDAGMMLVSSESPPGRSRKWETPHPLCQYEMFLISIFKDTGVSKSLEYIQSNSA